MRVEVKVWQMGLMSMELVRGWEETREGRKAGAETEGRFGRGGREEGEGGRAAEEEEGSEEAGWGGREGR
jgi:hypothetical protein